MYCTQLTIHRTLPDYQAIFHATVVPSCSTAPAADPAAEIKLGFTNFLWGTLYSLDEHCLLNTGVRRLTVMASQACCLASRTHFGA